MIKNEQNAMNKKTVVRFLNTLAIKMKPDETISLDWVVGVVRAE